MLQYDQPVQRVFHSLADPTRLAMFEQLSRGPASVSELASPLPVSLSAVVQHLAVLEADGLVTSRKIGRVRTCRVEPAALQTAADWVEERRAMCARSLDRLGDYLDATADRATKKERKKGI
jgi:DNA-binding transcriptional ArsR family regulator